MTVCTCAILVSCPSTLVSNVTCQHARGPEQQSPPLLAPCVDIMQLTKAWSPPTGGPAVTRVLNELKASKSTQSGPVHHECIIDKPSDTGFTTPRTGARDKAQDPRATSKPYPWPPSKRSFSAGTKDDGSHTNEAASETETQTANACRSSPDGRSFPWDSDGRPTRPDTYWLKFAADPEGNLWREFPRISTLSPADVRRQAELLPVPDEEELDRMLLDGCKEFEWQRLHMHHWRVLSWALRRAAYTGDYIGCYREVEAYIDANRDHTGPSTGADATRANRGAK